MKIYDDIFKFSFKKFKRVINNTEIKINYKTSDANTKYKFIV